ncbi:hypothetical protein ACP70R_022412 [Stipagrostis hirtigluma subsp. patula]
MALWDALAPAATVAQLVGGDAAGLVSATLQAVRTARRNRRECRSLARRVMMVGDLLRLVQAGSETARRPEVRRALDGLGGALRRAYELVESCQGRGAAYGFVMAGRQAEQFRDVQAEIDSYLLVFPVVSHIDITIRLDRIYNMLLPPDQPQQVTEAVPSSPTSDLEPHTRNEGRALGDFQLEENQTVTEHSEFEECQIEGVQEGLEELLTRDQRLKWLCWLPQQDKPARPVYDLLKAATNNFSSENEIGCGGWSTVYKAHIGGLEVAIKRYPSDARSSASQYDSEFQVLKKLQHTNIIKLLGNCTGQGEMILVYEYMPNGSLDKYIFDVRRGVSLNWLSRLRIIEGIAHGLLYLHSRAELCIVHRDLKPSNILLGSDMNAKISDFGIAKMLCPEWHQDTYISGTHGYIAPEYLRGGILSTKVDVYAYGVILLEVISAKKSIVPCLQNDEYVSFTEHAWHLWTTRRSIEFLDPSLRNEDQITHIIRCIQVALLCVQTDPADRPSMSDVLLMLGNKKIISFPKVPADLYQADGYESEATLEVF